MRSDKHVLSISSHITGVVSGERGLARLTPNNWMSRRYPHCLYSHYVKGNFNSLYDIWDNNEWIVSYALERVDSLETILITQYNYSLICPKQIHNELRGSLETWDLADIFVHKKYENVSLVLHAKWYV